ncbi:MAG: PRC-barrel domain-containing protein [Candidatus Hydrogenedentota bacterium]
MLRGLKGLIGYTLEAKDGRVGTVSDFYFEADSWRVLYVVAETGTLMPGRKVLVETGGLLAPEWNAERFPVACSKQEILARPGLEEAGVAPDNVPEDAASMLHWAPMVAPQAGVLLPVTLPERHHAPEAAGDHLYSFCELLGYRIRGADAIFGRLEDIVFENEEYALRLGVVNTGTWFSGRRVYIPCSRVQDIETDLKELHIPLPRSVIESAPTLEDDPAFDPSQPLRLEAEQTLYDYYGRQQPVTSLERDELLPIAEDVEYTSLHSRNRHKKVEEPHDH